MLHVTRLGDSRHSRRSIASTSVLALAMSILVCLVPSRPAEAVENCPAILGTLTSLNNQYAATQIQMTNAIAAAVKVNGKVDIAVVSPYVTAYIAATNTANAQLPGQGTCQNWNAVGFALGGTVSRAIAGGKIVLSSVIQVEAALDAMVPLETGLVTLIQTTEQASPGSKQRACLAFGLIAPAVFPDVAALCGM